MPLAKGVSHGTGLEQQNFDWDKHLENLQKEFFKMKSGSAKYRSGSNKDKLDKLTFSDRQVFDSGSVSVETNGFPRPRSRSGYVSTGGNPLYVDTPDGGLKFQVEFELDGFKPEEINIKTDGGTLFVHAKHEEVSDGTRRTSSEYKRKVEVPSNVDPDTMKSFFTSDGILTIEAPVRPSSRPGSRAGRTGSPMSQRARSISSSNQDTLQNGWGSDATDGSGQWDTLDRSKSAGRGNNHPGYSQSLKRQASTPRVNGSLPKYAQRETDHLSKSLPRKTHFASTSALPMNKNLSMYGRTSPLTTTQTEWRATDWDNADEKKSDARKSTSGHIKSVSREGAPGQLTIKTDTQNQRTRNYSESESPAPRSPSVLRDLINGEQESGHTSPNSLYSSSVSSQHSIMNDIPVQSTGDNRNEKIRALSDQFTNEWAQDRGTQQNRGRVNHPPSYGHSISDFADAGYQTGSLSTSMSNTPSDFPSLRRGLYNRSDTGIHWNENEFDTNKNKVDRRQTIFSYSTLEPRKNEVSNKKKTRHSLGGDMLGNRDLRPRVGSENFGNRDRYSLGSQRLSHKQTRHSLGGDMLANRDNIPESAEPRFHTPIIMNTGGGRKLRMVVDIGPPFSPDNINVKSTSNKVIIEARKVVHGNMKQDRIGFKREVKLPEAIDPHTLKALFNDKGRLTLTASVKAA